MIKLLPALVAALVSCAGAMAAQPCAELASRIPFAPDAMQKSPATEQVRALFDAANSGDEAAFEKLLPAIPRVDEYMIGGEKLLHRLLRPAKSLVDDEAAWRKEHRDDDDEHWTGQQRRHAALFAAKARMLALTLKAGAGVRDADESGAAPLHLAALYGSAEMVKMLVAAGADARQVGGFRARHEPLEFALRQEEAGQMESVVTPAERTRVVLALLDAGAPLPGQQLADLGRCQRAARNEPRLAGNRPHADFDWDDLLALTRGQEVLDRMVKLGTRPYEEDGGRRLFAFAAAAGNVEGVAWLKANVSRYDKDGSDRWVDGVIWALQAPPKTSAPILDMLLVTDLRWEQKGPARIDHHGRASRHVPSNGSNENTLLGRAILAGRADVVRRLAALGAPMTPDSAELLANAVAHSDIAMVRALLDLGVSPLSGHNTALALAVAPEGFQRLEYKGLHNGALPSLEQRREMLALLLAALRERKLAVPAKSPLLDWALQQATSTEGARLARMVLGAGVSAGSARIDGLRGALASPDRALFGELLGHGLMDGVDADKRGEYAGAILREVALADRADVLPALLALRPDLDSRGKDGLNAVDIAIRRGNVTLVEALLAAGATLSGADAKAGTALDHAILSGDAGVVRFIAAKAGQEIGSACVADSAALAQLVRTADDAYWTTLRKQGFGARHCPTMARRLITQLTQAPPTEYAGWLGERVRRRMADLYADNPRTASDSLMELLLQQPENGALAQVLQHAGWPAAKADKPEQPRAAAGSATDRALRKKLPGDYEKSGRELVSGIRLRADGTFSYMLMYGGVDEELNGVWTVEDGRVRIMNTPAPAVATPFVLDERSLGEAPAGTLAIDVYYHGRKVPRVNVTALGDQPALASGTTGSDGWRAEWLGPVRQIVLAHPAGGGGRPYVFDVPAALATRTRFSFTVPKEVPNRTFDERLDIEEDTLVWRRAEGEFTYRRTSAAKKQ